MNFLGHAELARRHRPTDAFVLGAMLPDFASMARARLREVTDPEVRAGVAFHHRTDAAFHGAPAFVAACRRSTTELTDLGVRRGTARAAAHLGLELLLDGWLLGRDEGLGATYRTAVALAHRPTLRAGLIFAEDAHAGRFSDLLGRLAAWGTPSGYDEPAEVAARLERMLSGRPRLEVRAADRAGVERWLGALWTRLPSLGPRLMSEAQGRLDGRSARNPE